MEQAEEVDSVFSRKKRSVTSVKSYRRLMNDESRDGLALEVLAPNVDL